MCDRDQLPVCAPLLVRVGGCAKGCVDRWGAGQEWGAGFPPCGGSLLVSPMRKTHSSASHNVAVWPSASFRRHPPWLYIHLRTASCPQCCLLTGATTNSDSGVTDITRVLPALRCVWGGPDV